MEDMIHHITRLSHKGGDPTDISKGKSDDLAIAKAMKRKHKLEKKKKGYATSSINDKVVKVMTQILAGKVMCKCHVDEVPMPV